MAYIPPFTITTDILNLVASISEQAKDHPLISSCVFHYEFEFIHPFADGNGRMGRLWQTLILSQWHPLFLSLPLESVIKDHQAQYYQALEQADEQGATVLFLSSLCSAP